VWWGSQTFRFSRCESDGDLAPFHFLKLQGRGTDELIKQTLSLSGGGPNRLVCELVPIGVATGLFALDSHPRFLPNATPRTHQGFVSGQSHPPAAQYSNFLAGVSLKAFDAVMIAHGET
jgi:hypothetical protein